MIAKMMASRFTKARLLENIEESVDYPKKKAPETKRYQNKPPPTFWQKEKEKI